MQVVANVLGIPVVRYAGSETGPAFGAARLARMALTGESAARRLHASRRCSTSATPDPALAAAYAERFEAYARLYRGLRPAFRP